MCDMRLVPPPRHCCPTSVCASSIEESAGIVRELMWALLGWPSLGSSRAQTPKHDARLPRAHSSCTPLPCLLSPPRPSWPQPFSPHPPLPASRPLAAAVAPWRSPATITVDRRPRSMAQHLDHGRRAPHLGAASSLARCPKGAALVAAATARLRCGKARAQSLGSEIYRASGAPIGASTRGKIGMRSLTA